MVKNKIYIYGLVQGDLNTELVSHFYDLFYLEGPIEDFALCTSQGIVIYDPEESLTNKNYNYYRKMMVIMPQQLEELKDAEILLKSFDHEFGRERLINPRQFELTVGSVVKSKVQASLGVGYVKDIIGDEVEVSFPSAFEILNKKSIICHKSILRVITHIKEVQLEKKKLAR